MISSKMFENELFETIVFNEVTGRMKWNVEDETNVYGYFFLKRVASNFGFWLDMLGRDLEEFQ